MSNVPLPKRPMHWVNLPFGLIIVVASSALVSERTWADDASVARKVARIELARSIRSFAASTLANGQCLVKAGRLSQRQINQAMPIALREMGISPTVLSNPQVIKAAGMLQPELDDDCGLTSMDAEKARELVNDEL
jgi:hypothetical protein